MSLWCSFVFALIMTKLWVTIPSLDPHIYHLPPKGNKEFKTMECSRFTVCCVCDISKALQTTQNGLFHFLVFKYLSCQLPTRDFLLVGPPS